MKRIQQTNHIVFALFLSAALMNGCAKHGPDVRPAPPAAAGEQPDPRKIVVAKVNGVNLYMDSLMDMMNRLGAGAGGAQELKKRSLDGIILQELAYQQAKVQGISVGADKIDRAIKNLKENVGGEKEYAEYLAKENVTEADLRALVERSLTIELIYEREVLNKVSVPEDVVRQEYEKEKDLYTLPERASVIDVFVLKRAGRDSTKEAKQLLSRINADAGKDPWKLVLDGTFVVRNLELKKGREDELLESAKNLKPNDLSGVIETPEGSHILKLKSYSPEKQLTFEEVRSKLELKFKVPLQEIRTKEWEEELRKGAKIEIIDSQAGSQEFVPMNAGVK